MKKRRCSAPRGFTLIEVLLAIGLLGLVVTAIYSSWNAILRGSRVGLEAAAAAQRARIAMRVMEDALTSARMFVANGPYYGFVAENGSEASFSFVSRLPKSFPRGGRFGDLDVRRVTFSVVQGREGDRQLVLRQSPLLLEVDKDEEEYPLVLARHVRELRWEFWDMRRHDWIEEWAQTNQLPKMVKITLQLGQSGSYTTQAGEEISRIVGLASSGVQPMWQVPAVPVMPGMPGSPPGGTNRMGF